MNVIRKLFLHIDEEENVKVIGGCYVQPFNNIWKLEGIEISPEKFKLSKLTQ